MTNILQKCSVEQKYDAMALAQDCIDIGYFNAVVWTTNKTREFKRRKSVLKKGQYLSKLEDLFDNIIYVLNIRVDDDNIDEKHRAVVAEMSLRATLVVVDNAETLDDIEYAEITSFLRDNLPPPSKAVITSRRRWSGEGEYSIQLFGMSLNEGALFIQNEVHRWGSTNYALDLSDYQIEKIHYFTGGIPLAMKWVVGHLKNSKKSADEIIDRLSTVTNSPILEFCFLQSFRELSLDEKELLFTIATINLPADLDSIKRASSLHEYKLRDALDVLLSRSLIEFEHEKYTMIPLTQSFSKGLLNQNAQLKSEILSRISKNLY